MKKKIDSKDLKVTSLEQAKQDLARAYYSTSSAKLRAKIYEKFPELKPIKGR